MSAKNFCRNVCLFEGGKHSEEAKTEHITDITKINIMKLIKISYKPELLNMRSIKPWNGFPKRILSYLYLLKFDRN